MENIKFIIYKNTSNNDAQETIIYNEFNTLEKANYILNSIGENFSDDFFVCHYKTTNGFNGFIIDSGNIKYNFYIDKIHSGV